MAEEHRCLYEGKWATQTAHHKQVIEKLDYIKEQTTRTNGRVRKLEAFRLIVTVGVSVVLLTISFMIIAHNQGWAKAIINFGAK